MLVPKKKLEDLGLPYCGMEHDEIVDHTRWSVHYRVIFKMDGKYYEAFYSKGATELQDEQPWEHDDEIEITEVVLKSLPIWVSKD